MQKDTQKETDLKKRGGSQSVEEGSMSNTERLLESVDCGKIGNRVLKKQSLVKKARASLKTISRRTVCVVLSADDARKFYALCEYNFRKPSEQVCYWLKRESRIVADPKIKPYSEDSLGLRYAIIVKDDLFKKLLPWLIQDGHNIKYFLTGFIRHMIMKDYPVMQKEKANK